MDRVEGIESPEDFALSLLVYEQLLSLLYVVRWERGGGGSGGVGRGVVYPIGLPIRHYDSALKSCQPTSAAQHPDSSA